MLPSEKEALDLVVTVMGVKNAKMIPGKVVQRPQICSHMVQSGAKTVLFEVKGITRGHIQGRNGHLSILATSCLGRRPRDHNESNL